MINNLVTGISRKLNAVFGEEIRIYAETIPQGLIPPAFFIQLLQAGSNPVVGSRYRRNHSFDVLFFPQKNGTELQQCACVAEQLLDSLEYITALPNLTYRGTGLRSEIMDGILHVFVQYNLHVCKKIEPADLMEELIWQDQLKR